jgi:hypothetical protein
VKVGLLLRHQGVGGEVVVKAIVVAGLEWNVLTERVEKHKLIESG